MRMTPEEFIEFERKRQGKSGSVATTPIQRMQAKGRLPAGTMNKTEEAYSLVLEERKRAGEVLWWCFESIKFKLADRTYLTPDFAVMTSDGLMQFHDVKGAKEIIQDDAAVKMKVSAAQFPFVFLYCFPPKKKGGNWTLQVV